jgi:cytochrome b561
MLVMPVSRYLLSNAGGNAVLWFGVFTIPDIALRGRELSEAGREAHYVFAKTIGIVVALHLAAVVRHTAVKRDTVLVRSASVIQCEVANSRARRRDAPDHLCWPREGVREFLQHVSGELRRRGSAPFGADDG